MNREILRLAVPNIISNISVPLLSAVDTSLMGHISEAKLAAVGAGSMLFSFLFINFGFLRMGTTGITAQNFGRKDIDEAARTLHRAVFLALAFSATLLLFGNFLFEAGSKLMNIRPEHYPLVKEYFVIRIVALPAGLMLYAIFGWLFGMQNSFLPMLITIASNILNIVFSVYFVRVLNRDIAGVAEGTVLAQYISLLVVGIALFVKYRYVFKGFKISAILNPVPLKPFLKINTDIFIRTVLLTFVIFFLYALSSAAGGMVLASAVILLQFVNILSYGIDGFAYASESLSGKYYGAGNYVKLMKSVRYSFIYAGSLAVLCSLVFGFFNEFIISIFTDLPKLKAHTQELNFFVILIPPLAFAGYIWDGVFVGITAVKELRNSMIIASSSFLLTFYLSDIFYDTVYALWFSFLLFFAFRSLLQTFIFFRMQRKLNG